jgi:hypothetical protein
VLRVYIGSSNKPSYDQVIEKSVKEPIRVVGKLNEQEMMELMRGKKKHIRVVLSEKKFFGGENPIGER